VKQPTSGAKRRYYNRRSGRSECVHRTAEEAGKDEGEGDAEKRLV